MGWCILKTEKGSTLFNKTVHKYLGNNIIYKKKREEDTTYY